MQPNHYDLLGQRREAPEARPSPTSRESNNLTRSASSARRFRSEDSWVEISSQPSSSSLSSAATDEIVTTGLRVQHEATARRRRLNHPSAVNRIQSHARTTSSNAGSSQDEYEESESESDRVMSSSNEDIVAGRQSGAALSSGHSATSAADSNPSSGDADEEDDDNATALGITGRDHVQVHSPIFTPQPNAFSHPPTSQFSSNRSSSAPDSYFPAGRSPSSRSSVTTTPHRSSSYRSREHSLQQQSHTPYNIIAPSHTADHDAALRASLSTLLSCAAAARGLPKNEQRSSSTSAGVVGANPASQNRIEAGTLRMVPESALLHLDEDDLPAQAPPLPNRPINSHRADRADSTSSSPPTSPAITKSKRKASASKDRTSNRPSTSSNKKSHSSDKAASSEGEQYLLVSPTLMTWLVSAGVVVMFSALSFSAGYAFGREVGRSEAAAMGGLGGCGNEVLNATRDVGDGWGGMTGGVGGGFRRLRWGGGAASASVR